MGVVVIVLCLVCVVLVFYNVLDVGVLVMC